jgi:hypothetical protein
MGIPSRSVEGLKRKKPVCDRGTLGNFWERRVIIPENIT